MNPCAGNKYNHTRAYSTIYEWHNINIIQCDSRLLSGSVSTFHTSEILEHKTSALLIGTSFFITATWKLSHFAWLCLKWKLFEGKHCCSVASVVSDSVWPHRWHPTRLPCPWDSPGKNTGVGCHFLLQCMKVKSESEVIFVSDSQRPCGPQPTRLLHPWDFPGKSTGVGCHCLLRR